MTDDLNSSFDLPSFLDSRVFALELAKARCLEELAQNKAALNREQRFSQRLKHVEFASRQEVLSSNSADNQQDQDSSKLRFDIDLQSTKTELRNKRTELSNVLCTLNQLQDEMRRECIEAAQETAMFEHQLGVERLWRSDVILKEKHILKKSLDLDEKLTTLTIRKEALEREYNHLHQDSRAAGHLIEKFIGILRGKGYKKLSVDRAIQLYKELKVALTLNQFSIEFLQQFVESHQDELGLSFDDIHMLVQGEDSGNSSNEGEDDYEKESDVTEDHFDILDAQIESNNE